MIKLTPKENKIILLFLQAGKMSSSDVHKRMTETGEALSLVTVKRALSAMAEKGFLARKGSGRATSYSITVFGRLFAEIDASVYIAVDPDKRYGLKSYNFELLSFLPVEVFIDNELKTLNEATAEYKKKTKDLPPIIHKKELERLVIELSWKSSRIEGNTYTLLDTEKLILENKPALGKTKEETRMILNHKEAFTFAYQNRNLFKKLTKANLDQMHALVVRDLKVGRGLRKHPVGVSGSIYRPLDNIYQITEAVEELCRAVSKMKSPYAKSMTALLGISYIQPFEDGNKRTSRLMADALLLAQGLAPLSYRSIEENEYREAVLTFYELNSLVPFKKIFIEQYEFAAQNYAV
jgi:Fic family protein/predicted transcriptional regulator